MTTQASMKKLNDLQARLLKEMICLDHDVELSSERGEAVASLAKQYVAAEKLIHETER